MVYVPNPDDAANPTDSVIAETATAEFQALKLKINTMTGRYNSGSPIWASNIVLPVSTTGTTAAPGTNTQALATTAFVFAAVTGTATVGFPNFITGFQLSNDSGTPATKIDIAAGACLDTTNTTFINSSSALVVDVSTTGALGLDTGSLSGATNLAILIIQGTSGISALATRETAVGISPTLPAGYTKYRYIGSVYYTGSIIAQFLQVGQTIYFSAPQAITLSAPNSTSIQLQILAALPKGINVKPILYATATDSNASLNSFSLTSGYDTSIVSGIVIRPQVVAKVTGLESTSLLTNTSGQLNIQFGSTTVSGVIIVEGYVNPKLAAAIP